MEGPIANPRSSAATITGLIVALGIPFTIPLIPGNAHQEITNTRQDVTVLVLEWILALTILCIVIYWERLPLRSIGFRKPSLPDAGAALAAVGVMVIGLGLLNVVHRSSNGTINGATPAQIAMVPLGLRIALFLTAGFCEELLFRAYAIERLAMLTRKLWIGGATATALFTLGHIPRYGLSVSLLGVLIIGTTLSLLYMWRRNFWLCATMHAIIDALGLVVAPIIATHARALSGSFLRI